MIMIWSRRCVQFYLLVGWLGFTLVAFRYFTFERLIDFDVDGLLLDINTLAFEQQLSVDMFDGLALPVNSIINFTDQECRCNKVSQIHINGLKATARKHEFTVLDVNPKESELVTSTPSVAITNNSGELVYFGPYGAGVSCSKTNGLAQTALDNYIKGYSVNMIVADVKGCYCHLLT